MLCRTHEGSKSVDCGAWRDLNAHFRTNPDRKAGCASCEGYCGTIDQIPWSTGVGEAEYRLVVFLMGA